MERPMIVDLTDSVFRFRLSGRVHTELPDGSAEMAGEAQRS